MALNLPRSGGGDYNPWIAWGASVSKWFVGGEAGKQEIEIEEVIIDFENLKTGWGLIAEGQPPTWVWNDDINNPDGKPDDRDGWKAGFGVTLYLGAGELYDFDTNSTGAVMGIDAAHDDYLLGVDKNKGKVPVYRFTGSRYAKVGKGNTNVPEFELVKWIDRPADLNNSEAANDEEVAEEKPAKKKAAGKSQF
jgi:hypothetical protein